MQPTTALHFSGGKDSLACLYLAREQWDEILVCWLNTGAAYPEVVEYMQGWKNRLPHFLEIKTDQPRQVEREGYPSEVVPMNATALGRLTTKGASTKVQSHFSCCWFNIWQPMQEAMKRLGIRRIIRGQRRDERRTSPFKNGYVDHDGVEYLLPIEDWTRAEVLAYLEQVGATLPPYYDVEQTSRDCWSCTAYLDENVARIRGLPDDKRAEVIRRLRVIEDAIWSDLAPMREILEAV